MTNRFGLLLSGVMALCAVAGGCGASRTGDNADLGASTGTDSGPSARVDLGTSETDSGNVPPDEDAGPAPEVDSGPVTPVPDAGPVAQVDAGGGGTRDPRLTSDPAPNRVACGAVACTTPTQVCCTSLNGQSCTARASCTGLAAPGGCDGPEDCASGQRCCVGFPSGANCGAGACGMGTQQLCGVDADCGAGRRCLACVPPGAPGGPQLVYGVCATGNACPSPYTAPR